MTLDEAKRIARAVDEYEGAGRHAAFCKSELMVDRRRDVLGAAGLLPSMAIVERCLCEAVTRERRAISDLACLGVIVSDE